MPGIIGNYRLILTQTYVESCVDLEVAHLPILMVRRLPYSSISYLQDPLITQYYADK